MMALRLRTRPLFLKGGSLVPRNDDSSVSVSVPSLKLNGSISMRLRNAGVSADPRAPDGVDCSSSRFLFIGVANASSKNRFPLDAGVLLKRSSSASGDCMIMLLLPLLGVAAMLASVDERGSCGFDGVAEKESNKPSICPSF